MGFGSEEICDLFKAETLAELSGKIDRKQLQLTEEIRRLEQKRLLRGGKPGAGARFVGRELGRAV